MDMKNKFLLQNIHLTSAFCDLFFFWPGPILIFFICLSIIDIILIRV